MGQPTNAEIMAAIVALNDRMERRFNAVDARFNEVDARFKDVDARFKESYAEQRHHAEAIAEVRGELRGLSAWLSSMDQRFVAIMRPYEPPGERGRA